MADKARNQVRLIDVAARAGVSATVVSKVLGAGAAGTVRVGDATAQRIRRIAREMNYRPNIAAQQLKGRQSNVIGVLIGAASTPANYERLFAVEHEASCRGHRLMIGQFRDEKESILGYLEDFRGRGIEALLCFHNPAPVYNPEVLKSFRLMRTVVFQTHSPLKEAGCVDVDRAAGVRQAVQYLAQRGRRKIGLVLGSASDPLMDDRRRGYLQGLKDIGQRRNGVLVWTGAGGLRPKSEELAAAVVATGGADAIIASNDFWAIGLIKTLRRQNLAVPRDVAVIGFDNLDAAELFDPALTTIDQNNPAFAHAVVDQLLDSLTDGSRSAARRTVIVQPRLIVRESA